MFQMMEERGLELVVLTGRWHKISEKSSVVYLNFILKGLSIKINFLKNRKKHNSNADSAIQGTLYMWELWLNFCKGFQAWNCLKDGSHRWRDGASAQCVKSLFGTSGWDVSSTIFPHYPYFWCNCCKTIFLKWKYFYFSSDRCVIS